MKFLNSTQTDQGHLRISVGYEHMGRPVEGATVAVIGHNDGGEAVQIEELRSDASGRCPEIELPTPPIDYSLTPESPMPYSVYDLRITAAGYEPIALKGLQVLPEATAVSNINLNPLGITAQELSIPQQIITISPHTLYKEYPPKYPEDEVKPLPEPTGFVVLDRVVVPETIVVHDGRPDNASAPRYYPLFRDYIKNVASSEIYATWPKESLKSNILAIISLTLNRVFTEWYRGQGKNFTITSSTQFDQAYFHGRNIFEEISQVVDDIFTTYITRPDIRQPLFSQYNDGKRVKNEGWLSQWGSKDLADKGYMAVDILKSYYGSDIYLDEAIKVAGVPSSFPGYALNIGASGDKVRTVQNQLNTISNNYPAIPKVAATGQYDETTAASVRKFQEIFNMPQTGIVDFATWYRISHIYVAVAKLAQ